jgi:hypothetical protein
VCVGSIRRRSFIPDEELLSSLTKNVEIPQKTTFFVVRLRLELERIKRIEGGFTLTPESKTFAMSTYSGRKNPTPF